MSVRPPPPPPRQTRFGLPPSLVAGSDDGRVHRLEHFLSEVLERPVEIYVAPNYETLAKEVLADRVDVAWAPPYVCARVEAMGVRIALRGVRRGTSSYRAVMVKRIGNPVDLDHLAGARVAWVDRDSVAGHLLPMSALKARSVVPATLGSQIFYGSYRAALQAVLSDAADVTSIFCALADEDAGGDRWRDAAELIFPGSSSLIEPVGFTDDSPNDGVAVSMASQPDLVERVERALLALHEDVAGRALLSEVFHAERFEPAPRLGYRALYRVSLSAI